MIVRFCENIHDIIATLFVYFDVQTEQQGERPLDGDVEGDG